MTTDWHIVWACAYGAMGAFFGWWTETWHMVAIFLAVGTLFASRPVYFWWKRWQRRRSTTPR